MDIFEEIRSISRNRNFWPGSVKYFIYTIHVHCWREDAVDCGGWRVSVGKTRSNNLL